MTWSVPTARTTDFQKRIIFAQHMTQQSFKFRLLVSPAVKEAIPTLFSQQGSRPFLTARIPRIVLPAWVAGLMPTARLKHHGCRCFEEKESGN